MTEIDDFLRENKPQVKDDPTFILETQRRLGQVEGIKAEVDRQRHHGRVALIAALVFGLVLGVCAASIAFLYPADTASVKEGFFQSTCSFLQTYRNYILLPVAVLAIGLGFTLSKSGRQTAL